MRAARQGLSGVPDPFDGRIDRDPSGANAAAADPCQRDADQRSGAGAGQMVQPLTRIRLPDLRRGDPGYFRASTSRSPSLSMSTALTWAGAGSTGLIQYSVYT